jgi:YidC/Oxa1 family membrane protein insertase
MNSELKYKRWLDHLRWPLLLMVIGFGYALLLTWQNYSDQQKAKGIAEALAQQAQPASAVGNPAMAQPLIANTQPVATESDLPQPLLPQAVAPNQASTVGMPDAQNPAAQTISFETDILKGVISLDGGDMIFVSLKQYPAKLKSKEPFIVLDSSINPALGGLSYWVQSGVLGENGQEASTPSKRLIYRSAHQSYTLVGDVLTLDLVAEEAGRRYTKRYEIKKSDYLIRVIHKVENLSDQDWFGTAFSQIKRNAAQDPSAEHSGPFSLPTFLGFAHSGVEKKFNKLDFSDIADLNGQNALNQTQDKAWVAFLQHYFLSAWVNQDETPKQFYARSQGNYYLTGFTFSKWVKAGQTEEFTSQLYVGPKDQERLSLVADGLELSVDYGFLFMISQALFWVLTTFYAWVGNWGVAIILLTVVVKILFFYPSAISYRSMARMRAVQPKLLHLKELHASDRQKLSQEMMKLYRDEKINPLSGCLPVLLQMPVFLALYWMLLESVELRQAPFFGWILDLSTMDPYFILPLLMGASMYLQSMLNPMPLDPMQAQVMKFMPLIFTVFFLFFPSGLVLYWLTNNLLSIAQQYFIMRRLGLGLSQPKKT